MALPMAPFVQASGSGDVGPPFGVAWEKWARCWGYMDVSPKSGENPKMDGENSGSKAYVLMDDLFLFCHYFLETPIYVE